MGIPFSGVSILGNLINISVPSDGSDISLFIVGGAFSPGDTAVFQSPDGTAQVLDFLSTTIDTTTLTPSNPITLQAQGFACTGIFSPALAQYISGNGFSGDGSIVIEGLSAFFDPSDIASCLEYWVADGNSDFDQTGNIIWLGKKGDYRLQWNDNGVQPVFDDTTGKWVQFRQGGMNLQLANGTAVVLGKDTPPILRYRVSAFERLLNTNRVAEWSGGVRTCAGRFNDAGFAFAVGVWRNSESNWNGAYTTSLTEISGDSNYEGSGTTIPIDTPFIFSVSGNPDNDSGRQVSQFGVGSTGSDELEANVVGTAIFNANPTETDKLLVLRFFAFMLKDRLGEANYNLDSDLPDYNVRPLLSGGGGTSSFTGQVPVVSYDRIVSSAPAGSSIAIFKRSAALTADLSQFTLAAGNDSGDSDLVIKETIPVDTPATGFIRITRNDGSTEDRLAYSSWTGSTFTLDSITLPASYAEDTGCYVGYLDIINSSTGTESNNLQYVANRDCVLSIRLGSGAGRIVDIRQNVTLGASDFEFQASAQTDTINTYNN